MKRFSIALAAIAAFVSFSACVQEQLNNDLSLSEKDIAFAMKQVTTKGTSLDEFTEVKGESFEIKNDALGEGFTLEETVSSLDALYDGQPETKGIPIYNENFTAKREKLSVVIYDNAGEEAFGNSSYDLFDKKNRVWRHTYPGKNPWDYYKTETDDLFFFLHSDPTGKSSNWEYSVGDSKTDDKDMSVTFDYTSPSGEDAAVSQEDILFTGRTINKKQYDDNGWNVTGAPVTFYHALTAIKFRIANDNTGDTKTIITGVKFTNLKSTGTCTVKPNDPDNRVKWDEVTTKATFSQSFDNVAHSSEADKDNTVNFSDDGSFGGSFYTGVDEKGNKTNLKNLNMEDGSLTFFFIPQAITKETILEVTFRVKTTDSPQGKEITHEINFGEQLAKKNVVWNAGEIRTYTLKPLDVDVKITDSMNGFVKSNLHVSNTGNVDEFVRMIVMGNWYDKDGNILVGYKYAGNEEGLTDAQKKEMIDPWFRENTTYGEFDESFAGGKVKEGRTDWVKAKGGFYYTQKIGPGQSLESVAQSMTKPLFETYTLDNTKIPTIYVPVKGKSVREPAQGVHLVMEIVVQAIGADGYGDTEWQKAWYDATGIPELNPTPSTSGD